MKAHLRVIILTDLSNGYQRLGVLVWLVWIDVVEGCGLGGVTVATREVNTHCEVDLTTAHDVIQECVRLGYGLKGLNYETVR